MTACDPDAVEVVGVAVDVALVRDRLDHVSRYGSCARRVWICGCDRTARCDLVNAAQ